METLYRLFSGIAASILAVFAPVSPLIISTVVFIGVDFLTGVAADRAENRRLGRAWRFQSRKAWNTVLKLLMALLCIILGWLLEHYILDFMRIPLSRIFTGFICGVELWSFLENAAELSDAPVFLQLRQYARRHTDEDLFPRK